VAVYELAQKGMLPLTETTFDLEGVKERSDLQRVLRDRIEVLVPDAMVLTEEFGAWDDSKRRIDLLGLDQEANLVVVELKRGGDGFMDLQAIRYAAMVSTMTFAQAVEAHRAYLQVRGSTEDPRDAILKFLGWDEPSEDDFGQDVRVVLAAADFSKELTTALLWLNDRGLDFRCVRVKPYSWEGRILVDVQQVIPLPEAAEYQVKVREKVRREREDRKDGRDFTKYDVTIEGETLSRLPKRRTMFHLVRHLTSNGVSVAQISKLLDWRGSGLWRSVDGVVGPAEFSELATEAAAAGGPAFEPRRWFVGEHELIVDGGRTYALTKMWGHGTEQAIRDLLATFPLEGLSVVESEDEA
jgi:hypothetical protein